jgi:hypothetical protein
MIARSFNDLQFWMTSTRPKLDRWGDYPTWAAVVVATCALVTAGLASRKVYRLEKVRDNKADAQRVSAQAELVTGWLIGKPVKDDSDQDPDIYFPGVAAVVSNASMQPITNVRLIWRIEGRSLGSSHEVRIPPNSYRTFDIPNRFLNELELVGRNYLNSKAKNVSEKESESLSNNFQIIFGFDDSLGHQWERNEKGSLIQKY